MTSAASSRLTSSGSERYVGTKGTTAIANAFNAIAGEDCSPGTVNLLDDPLRGTPVLAPDAHRSAARAVDAPATHDHHRDRSRRGSATAQRDQPEPSRPGTLGRLPQPRRPRASHDSVQGGLHRPVRHRRPRRVLGRHDLRRGGCREQAARAVAGGPDALPTPTELGSALFDFNMPTHALDGAAGHFLISADGDEQCQGLPIIIYRNGTVTRIRRRRSLDVRKAQIGPAVLPFSRVMTIRWGQEMRTAADLVTALGRRGG